MPSDQILHLILSRKWESVLPIIWSGSKPPAHSRCLCQIGSKSVKFQSFDFHQTSDVCCDVFSPYGPMETLIFKSQKFSMRNLTIKTI